MRIALAGNPNSGKTTLFNAITGKIEHVGNWPGVTVEKKEGNVKQSLNSNKEDLVVVDLPGAYSMSPYTSEESITKDFVQNDHPDAIINIVDSTNLSRSLFFTTQLLELGIPVVVALNKSDIVKKKDTIINVAALSEALKCPVIETISTKSLNNGLFELLEAVIAIVKSNKKQAAPNIRGVKNALTEKKSEKADKNRFVFVNSIVF